jgi:hypothetical protein
MQMLRCQLTVALLAILAMTPAGAQPSVRATRFAENPLITLKTSPSIGDNANGPTVIRVPRWVQRPLGRYYMYFAHHSGQFIRLAYADSVRGPWKVHEPGVLHVKDTAFYRPQPDPTDSPAGVYTHIASPEVYVDEGRQRLILWTHGMWTEGQRWPDRRADAAAWVRQHGYAQFTQAAESSDGLTFHPRPAITRQSYLRVVPFDPSIGSGSPRAQSRGDGRFYGMARLGQLLRASNPLDAFELGGSPFRDSPYAGRVRHVALLEENGVLHVLFSAIGDAPESILHTAITITGDWRDWKIGPVSEVLAPQASYECPNLPVEKSMVGEIDRPARQLRDPALFRDEDRLYLFYTFCGEQGIAGAELTLRPQLR